jgi:asparagine synthase (glutamine-hydrolysing)
MCGIAGIVDTRNAANVEAGDVRRMCARIVYRGPDDEGIFVKGGTGLGMRRLSIIDVAGGHQPVFNEEGNIWIVFNGEVYNFPDLRPELEAKGHVFRTHSDTEVIVHLYEEMGAECVQKLRGMFAFAIYDERKQKLFIARDRLGKKPLHYAFDHGQFFFGSEIKSILEVAPHLAEVNETALWQYMYLGYVPDPATAFRKIHKLPPGHLLELENGQVHVRKYWDIPEYAVHQPKSEEECLEELEHRLEEAVRIRLISDVPLGAMLSGGTDSSAVVALMARLSSSPVKTFSIGFEQADFNEAEYARIVAEKFGTAHHELILKPDVIETVNTLTHSLEEPFGDSSMLPTYYISRLARQHVTVALSGDGGDELFAGYERYKILLHDRSHSMPDWAGKFYRGAIHPLLPYRTPGRNLAYSVSLPWQERYLEGVTIQAFIREMKLLTPEFRDKALSNGHDSSLDPLREYLNDAPAKDALSRVLYLDTKTYLAGDILTKVDRMSMLTSLEARVPILDHKFVEWVSALKPEWKMRGDQQKYIFRKLAERVGVPREVLYRKKQGFALPLVHWMRHELKPMILDVLLDRQTLKRGYFQEQGLRRLLDEHFQQRRDHSARIWRFLIFELWHRNFLEEVGAPVFTGHPIAAISGSVG